jgi:hypothetical protein
VVTYLISSEWTLVQVLSGYCCGITSRQLRERGLGELIRHLFLSFGPDGVH